MSFQPIFIAGYNTGLETNKKPFLLMDSAFPELFNSYVWRERVKKREGIKLVGRLRRCFTTPVTLGTQADGASYSNADILADASFNLRTTEPNAAIEPGSFQATVGALVFIEADPPDGTLSAGGNNTGTINYATGELVLNFDPALGAPTNVDVEFCYFPALPVMGIDLRDIATINVEDSIFFDTTYSYSYNGNDFNEVSSTTSTTWSGTDSDFFWMANYRGVTADIRLFFVTNFTNPDAANYDPPRYYNGITWAQFTPDVSATHRLYQAKIFIPYYGRLLALNTWEGTIAGAGAGSVNLFNRCRFSQIGNPLESTVALPVIDLAWRSDIFGRGGFVDAPTNEAIVSAKFYKNVLIVFFERSTWLLRYVGEYGFPFIWERISSDFGSESTFSTVLFDSGVLAVGDKAIVGSSGNDVQRIDLQIPDTVFNFHNQQGGKQRVHSERDFQKEIVYWSYSDGGLRRKFPNRVLLFNYRNGTYSIFRDNVTTFGQLTSPTGISWDTPTPWDEPISWDTIFQGEFPAVVSGNQQGYIHWYQYTADMESNADTSVPLIETESLQITAITRSLTDPIRITVPDHNLENEEIIYIVDMLFMDAGAPLTTDLNDRFYLVQRVDDDNLDLFVWDFVTGSYITTAENSFLFTPATGTGEYIGGGELALIPKLSFRTKDFNPFQEASRQIQINHVDFQTDATPNSAVSVNALINASTGVSGNLVVGNTGVETTLAQFGNIQNITQDNPAVVTSENHGLLTGMQIEISNVVGMTQVNSNMNFYTITFIDVNNFELDGIDSTALGAYIRGGDWSRVDQPQYYVTGSQYAWHRFYATVYGQYISLQITYDENLMNIPITHQQNFELNAINISARPAGKIIF